MEAPPLSTTPPIPSTTPQKPAAYTDSGNADPPPPKLRLMCSYGGHIVPRPHDKALSYVGGDSRIVVADRHATLSDLHRRLSRSLLRDQPFSLKYQLPSEELDSLISVSTDEDLENMVEEYDRLNSASAGDVSKPGRLRLFLFPKSESSVERILAETASAKSEEWFFSALNGKSGAHSAAASDRGFSDSSSVNCLLGLDDDIVGKASVVESGGGAGFDDLKAGVNGNENPNGNNHVINQDVQSVPNSPMLGTSSSFGSTSSSPSVANLPPIKSQTQPRAQEQVYVLPDPYEQNPHRPQTFIHAGNQYVSANVVPISSYYPIYPPQLQNQHHYHPVYFVPNQLPYNQSRSVPPSTGPKLVTSGSEQFVGLSPIYQPPSGQNAAYGYEFVNQNNVPVYYNPLLPQMAAATGMVVPDASREAEQP
ncbi:Octicosapeptide/Phox/Bem1p family protein [Striga hermonthica]|uniref:Octicosapeptide/Phox/Bem1p family protein n=1 Tax=Striga hermonthica TaxID=68872 RepID=A0A9N7RJC0_STRHE|nr:Octicosapeptide/Phox/Bem1p family protein [Striga hermonthica]